MVLNIDKNKCLSCGGCISVCPKDALTLKNMSVDVDLIACTDCATCTRFCPVGALYMTSNL